MKYLYETHLHTKEASACAKSKGNDYIEAYKKRGYDGIIVTDHFFNGNSCIPKDIPWEQRIDLFCQGYENAKKEGDRQGLKVFLGWEVNFEQDEYLVYGLDADWLKQHPDMLCWDQKTHYEKVKEAGGFVVQAHPFRERSYIHKVNLHPFQCDAWEVANAGNLIEQNRMAFRYANEKNILMTVGSDTHNVTDVNEGNLFAMAFEQPLFTIQDYIEQVKGNRGIEYVVPSNQFEPPLSESLQTPVCWYNKENKPMQV